MKQSIEDLKIELEYDQAQYLSVIATSPNKTSRDVCYGKLDIIKKVLDFLKDNNL